MSASSRKDGYAPWETRPCDTCGKMTRRPTHWDSCSECYQTSFTSHPCRQCGVLEKRPQHYTVCKKCFVMSCEGTSIGSCNGETKRSMTKLTFSNGSSNKATAIGGSAATIGTGFGFDKSVKPQLPPQEPMRMWIVQYVRNMNQHNYYWQGLAQAPTKEQALKALLPQYCNQFGDETVDRVQMARSVLDQHIQVIAHNACSAILHTQKCE